MSDVIIDVGSNRTSRINLGIQGENIVEHVIFDISKWIEEYGEGVAFIYAQRRGDEEPYPVALDMDMTAKTATWEVNLTDTAEKGKGSAQLVYVVDEDNDEDFMDDEVKKTKVYSTTVQASLVVASDENPSGYETWLEVLGGYIARIETANLEAAAEAMAQAIIAKSYATGDTESRTGEETDNAKYYSEQARASEQSAAQKLIDVTDAANAALQAIGQAGTTQVTAVNTAGTTNVDNVNSAGTTQVKNVNDAGEAQIADIAEAGESQVSDINTAGEEIKSDLDAIGKFIYVGNDGNLYYNEEE